jgi:hypothetical protein
MENTPSNILFIFGTSNKFYHSSVSLSNLKYHMLFNPINLIIFYLIIYQRIVVLHPRLLRRPLLPWPRVTSKRCQPMNAGGPTQVPSLSSTPYPGTKKPTPNGRATALTVPGFQFQLTPASSGGGAAAVWRTRDAGDGGGLPGDTEAGAALPADRSIPLVSLLSPLPASQRRVCHFARSVPSPQTALSPCRDDSYGAGPHDGRKNWRSAEAALVVRYLIRSGVALSVAGRLCFP